MRINPSVNWSAWLLALALAALPPLAYWNTTFHYFGLRDDYSNLREAHEEPAKIIRFTASHARPLFGVLVQSSFEIADSIEDLAWLRFAGALGLGIISAALFGLLRRSGWDLAMAFFVAAMIALAPPAQVIAGWAIAWPYTVAAILSLMGYALANGFGRLRPATAVGAALLVAIGALIYQPSSLFYCVGLATALPCRRSRPLARNLMWIGAHLGIVLMGLSIAFLTMRLFYATGVFEASSRLALEHDFSGKLAWFFREPLPNALNILVLNDDDGTTRLAYRLGAISAALLLAVGAGMEWRKRGRPACGFWLFLLAVLPLAAFAANLVTAERVGTYRTIFALTSVMLIFLTLSWRNLCHLFDASGRSVELVGYGLTLALAVHNANVQAYTLIAAPQGEELRRLQQAADHLAPRSQRVRVYCVQPGADDRPVKIAYHDEFGAMSTDSEWVLKEMFEQILRERFPDGADPGQHYLLQAGFQPPPVGAAFDLVIDLRKLRIPGSDRS